MDAWFRLMRETARNATTAQETFGSLTKAATPEELARHMAQMAAGTSSGLNENELMRMWEDWWRAMGVVPRSRYLELLEENDALRRQLREAEQTIERLRTAGRTADKSTAQVQQAAQAWENMFQQMLDAQSQWMQAWAEQRSEQKPNAADDEQEPPDSTGTQK